MSVLRSCFEGLSSLAAMAMASVAAFFIWIPVLAVSAIAGIIASGVLNVPMQSIQVYATMGVTGAVVSLLLYLEHKFGW